MELHSLKRAHPHKQSRRVGRGGKRGKTAGRGTKGQKARAGHRIRPEMRDIIKKFPKHRGYKQRAFRPKPIPVNLSALEAVFAAGSVVTPNTLVEKGLVKRIGGKIPPVKILGASSLTKQLTVSGCLASKTAKERIEAAGGSFA